MSRLEKEEVQKAHNLDNVIQVRTNLILKEKHNRKYPNISEGDYVKIFDKKERATMYQGKKLEVNGVKKAV